MTSTTTASKTINVNPETGAIDPAGIEIRITVERRSVAGRYELVDITAECEFGTTVIHAAYELGDLLVSNLHTSGEYMPDEIARAIALAA